MDGQIGIEELYIREDESEEEDSQVFVEPIDGQMTFEEYEKSKGFEYIDDANTGDIEVIDNISLDRNKHLENLNEFFKEEKLEVNEEKVEDENVENLNDKNVNEESLNDNNLNEEDLNEEKSQEEFEFLTEENNLYPNEEIEEDKNFYEQQESENALNEETQEEPFEENFEEEDNAYFEKLENDFKDSENKIEEDIKNNNQNDFEVDSFEEDNTNLNFEDNTEENTEEDVAEDFENFEYNSEEDEFEEEVEDKIESDTEEDKTEEDEDQESFNNFESDVEEDKEEVNKDESVFEDEKKEENSFKDIEEDDDRTALDNFFSTKNTPEEDEEEKDEEEDNYNESSSTGANRALKSYKGFSGNTKNDNFGQDYSYKNDDEEGYQNSDEETQNQEDDDDEFSKFLDEKFKEKENEENLKTSTEQNEDQESFEDKEKIKNDEVEKKQNLTYESSFDEKEENRLENLLSKTNKDASEDEEENNGEDGQDENEKEGVTNLSNEEEKKNSTKNKKEESVKSSKKDSTIQDENFFENEENSQTIKDVADANKGIKDIDVNVGRDVFANYESATIEASEVNEKEVEAKQEKVYSEDSGNDVIDGMLYKSLDSVFHESMIPYSEHVILDRALPRVEDGLKPVQRRILYSMLELGVTPDKPYRKSARIVGDCLGKYHPHGDSSVYQAMVRMAQPFNQNELLVSGHGNFGSVDGDGAAAMRYTEARLAPLAMELLRDLDKNTVKWGLNFDDTLKEPEILPGRFPNLLVNGTMGIAVGLATNIPPHNLAETIDGVVAYINKPSITLKDMLKIIKGPDFPTGGYILNNSEIIQAYETGKGKFYLRAKMHIESNGNDKRYIVITELPYQVNKSSLLQKIANYREEGKYGFENISEIRDESDREGLRAVIRVKKDADLKTLYESLLKNTELQTTFGMNMVAIANGKPKQMGLLDVISYYAEYQREVILRRSKYDLEQAKEREHILSGLIIAIKNIDAVVKIIKTSQNTTEAKKRLREKFVLSEKQAQAILDMRLARLTSLEVYKLEAEVKKLRELIKHLTAVINSKRMQYDIVKEELLQIKKQYKTDRKTRMMRSDESIKIDEGPKEMPAQNVVILKSAMNTFKCLNTKQYNYANKEVGDNNTLYDVHVLKFETESTKTLLAFTNLGNCFKVDVKEFGESRYRDKGVIENKIFKELGNNETIVALFDFEDTKGKENILFLTKFGMIKKTAISEYGLLKKYFQAMKLRDDDEILSIVKEPTDYTVVLVSKTGMILNAESKDIPLQGRISGGVKGINLADKDYCVGVSLAGDAGEVVCVTDKGYSKRVLLSNIDKMARYRKGLKFITFDKNNGSCLVFASVVTNPYTLGCVDKDNNFYYRSTDLVPIEARIGKGKPVDKTKKNLSLTSAFKIDN